MRTVSLTLCLALVLALSSAHAGGAKDKAAGKGQKVTMTGTLKTGIFAIGGETTGTILRTKKGTYELDLGKNKDLRTMAKRLDGKMVEVTGTLNIRKGVEVKERRIITVDALKAKGAE